MKIITLPSFHKLYNLFDEIKIKFLYYKTKSYLKYSGQEALHLGIGPWLCDLSRK